ncbi:MAG: dephospho-CoA kinase [Candidatus Coatesbacteria bacterium]
MAGLVIGLTGGTGTGKTALAGYLRRLGAAYYSVDAAAHVLYARDRGLVDRLVRIFGPRVAGPGGVDRAALGTAAFGSAGALSRLNAAIQSPLRREARAAIARMRLRHRVTVVEAGAILFDLGLAPLADRIVVTRCGSAVRRRRLARRRGMRAAEVCRRMAILRPAESRMLAAARRCRRARLVETGGSPESLGALAVRLMGEGYGLRAV